MTIETMAREFRYDGVRLPDPNPKLRGTTNHIRHGGIDRQDSGD